MKIICTVSLFFRIFFASVTPFISPISMSRRRIYKNAESLLFDFEGESDFDILLLDIEMGDMNGMTLAKIYGRRVRPCR